MSKDLREIIKQEYILCAKDPSHFMRKYCYIQHPNRGRIKFALYKFQEKVLMLWRDNPYSIILKSRQLGISTLSAGYSLWLMMFHEDKNVLCIATKQDTAKNMVTKVKFMYHNLPSWLKESKKPEEDNKLTLRLNNGSQIKATSAASDAGRSEAVSLLLIDEAAFIDGIDEIWASSQQTLATGGGAIVLSTPYGTGNWFHKTWEKAESKDNQFLPIRLPWSVHPERDQAWRDNQDKLLGDPRLAAQECDCDFATSGDTVFYTEYIDWYRAHYMEEPIEKRGTDQNLWIWEQVDYSKVYLVVADVARGDGQDFSTAHVIDIEANKQVAEYKGQIGTTEFGHFLVSLATEYNNALLAPENASIGWSTIQTILDRAYTNLYYSPKSGEVDSSSYFSSYMDTSKMTPGLTVSLKNRPVMINKLQESLFDKSVVIKSSRTLNEMQVFIWKNGKAQAQSGYNDDLIIPLAASQYLRETAFKFGQQGIKQTKSILNAMSNDNTKYSGGYSNQNTNKDAFKIKNPYGGEEDISWLL